MHCDFVLKEQENQGRYHTQTIWTNNYELVLTFNSIDEFGPTVVLEFYHKFLYFLSYADRASKGTVRRANSFNSAAVIVAAGESSKTDTREFIEKQQQLLDGFKKSPSSDEDVTMNDDERTDSASFNLNFDDKHFQIPVSHNQPITTQPGFSEAGYSDYVNIDKDGNEEAWNSYNKAGEYGMFVHWNSSPLVLCCEVQLYAQNNKKLNYQIYGDLFIVRIFNGSENQKRESKINRVS